MWVTLAAVVAVEGFYYSPWESNSFAEFDQQHFEDPFQPLTTYGLFQNSLFDEFVIPSYWELFRPEPRYMNFLAPPKSLLNYRPARKNPKVTPNVFVNGRGYTTDRYVAPSVVKRYLAMNPR